MAAAFGDAAAPGGLAGEQVGVFPLLNGHRADHRFDALELGFALLEHPVVDLVHPRDHFHQAAEGAHALDQAHLFDEIGEVEAGFLQLALHLLDIGDLNFLLGLLHEGEHITHAEDAAGHPLGVERLQRLHLLAGADEFDRRAAHLADREGGATPGVAVHLGEHGPGDAHLLMERAGEFSGLLADHRIHHQQHLIGCHGAADPHHLLHHRGVDLEAAGGVNDHRVEAFLAALGQARFSDRFGLGIGAEAEHLHIDLLAQRLQLIDGRGPVGVGGHQQRFAPLLFEVQAELGGGGGFTGALQAGHQHHGGGLLGFGQGLIGPAHHLNELLVDELDELLIGADAPHHISAEGFLAHLSDEAFDHRQADVGVQQGAAHIFEGAVDVALADRGLALEAADGILKPLGELFKHQRCQSSSTSPPS